MDKKRPQTVHNLGSLQSAVWMHVLGLKEYANEHENATPFDIEITEHWLKQLMVDAPPNRHKRMSDCLVAIGLRSDVVK
jgi:hypothetical protein